MEESIQRISSKKSVDVLSEKSKLRLDKNVKLHELSRQQLHKQ